MICFLSVYWLTQFFTLLSEMDSDYLVSAVISNPGLTTIVHPNSSYPFSIKLYPEWISLSFGLFLRFLIIFSRFVLFLQCFNAVLDNGVIIFWGDLIFMFKVALISLLVVWDNLIAHIIVAFQKASDSALSAHIVVGWVHAVWCLLGSIVIMIAGESVVEGAKFWSWLSIWVVLPIAVLSRVQIVLVTAKTTFLSRKTLLFYHCFRDWMA